MIRALRLHLSFHIIIHEVKYKKGSGHRRTLPKCGESSKNSSGLLHIFFFFLVADTGGTQECYLIIVKANLFNNKK